MNDERFFATYLIETSHPPEQAAEVMAGEQSSGTFVRVPGETDELRELHAGRVERVTLLDLADMPGFHSIRLDVPRLLDPVTAEQECDALMREALAALEGGESVLFYSARGPGDPALNTTRSSDRSHESPGRRLGTAQARLLGRVLERAGVTRICVAGGDTSSYVIQQLGISAMSISYPLARGAPLCRAYSVLPRLDGLELSLKGGQVGAVDFFGRVRNGQ